MNKKTDLHFATQSTFPINFIENTSMVFLSLSRRRLGINLTKFISDDYSLNYVRYNGEKDRQSANSFLDCPIKTDRSRFEVMGMARNSKT